MPTYRTPDRVQLNYKIAGDARPTIILIHGWGSRLDHWQPAATALARHHRVLRMDLRGHGRSEAPTDGYSIRQFADDIGALARSQRITNAVVVGHSMGSTVALELARRHPRIVGSLVLVDGALDQYSTARDVERTDLWRTLTDAPYDDAIIEAYSQFFPDPRDTDLATRVVRDAARTPEHAASPPGAPPSPPTSPRSRTSSASPSSTSIPATTPAPPPMSARYFPAPSSPRSPAPATSSSSKRQTSSSP